MKGKLAQSSSSGVAMEIDKSAKAFHRKLHNFIKDGDISLLSLRRRQQNASNVNVFSLM